MMACGCKKTKVQTVVDKVKSIAKGWSNIVWESEEIKLIAYDRLKVCAECDRNAKGFCLDCGCWIPAKARSPEETCKYWI